jgi:hypothetical protein
MCLRSLRREAAKLSTSGQTRVSQEARLVLQGKHHCVGQCNSFGRITIARTRFEDDEAQRLHEHLLRRR